MWNNETLQIVGLLLFPIVESIGLAAPPTSPAPGSGHIVGVAAIGAWSGKDGKIAGFAEGGWQFVTPVNDAVSRSQPPRYGLWRSGGARIVGAEEVRIDGVRVVRPRPRRQYRPPTGGAVICR